MQYKIEFTEDRILLRLIPLIQSEEALLALLKNSPSKTAAVGSGQDGEIVFLIDTTTGGTSGAPEPKSE